jgi:3-carboxy-cis,cis-muconate cycloisomerase
MTISPFDHPWLSALLGDDTLAPHFSPEAEHTEILAFEAALAAATAAEGLIPPDSAAFIASHIGSFTADAGALAAATARDAVVIPEFVRQLREHLGTHGQYIHLGATSQDVLDTSLVRRLRPVLAELGERLSKLQAALDQLDQRHGFVPLMARTRMQDAVPFRASHRIATWRTPLQRHLDRLAELTPRLLVLQFGGAAGTLDKLGDKGPAVAARLAAALDLRLAPQWHAQRDNLAELASWLSLVSGSLGKLGADVALMAQMGEVALTGAGTSSAMPHKQNPVAAELLVTLARHNATLVGGMHTALVHEQERSGAAWTLEWLLLPHMVIATAAALRTALTLAGQVTRIGKP